jgi:hypothetical protein
MKNSGQAEIHRLLSGGDRRGIADSNRVRKLMENDPSLVSIRVTVSALPAWGVAEVGVMLLPFYVAVAAVYGTLAYFTDSTLPGMLLHAGGNMFSAFDLFTRARSEWQLSPEAKPLIWDTRPDAAFWGNVAALLIVAVLTVWAYSMLERAPRDARASRGA